MADYFDPAELEYAQAHDITDLPSVVNLIISPPNPRLGYFEVHPRHDHTHTVIFLHDRMTEQMNAFISRFLVGNVGSDGISLFARFPSVKWVFPTASSPDYPREGRFILGFHEERQWFDVKDPMKPWEEPEAQMAGMLRNEPIIREIINIQKVLVDSSKILLGGVGQGGAYAFTLYLSSMWDLGGFMGLSTFLPLYNCEDEKKTFDYKDMKRICQNVCTSPIFLDYSQTDDMFSRDKFEKMVEVLSQMNLDFYTYPNTASTPAASLHVTVDDMVHFLTNEIGVQALPLRFTPAALYSTAPGGQGFQW